MSERLAAVAIVCLTLVAGAVRLRYWGELPITHWDEAITQGVVTSMRTSGHLDTSWAKSTVPPAFRYPSYNFSSFMYAEYWFSRLLDLAGRGETLLASRDGLRLFSALCGSLVIPLIALVGWRTAGPAAAVLAASLTAVNPLLLQDSYYIRPEAMVTLLTCASVLFTCARRPVLWICAGFFWGLLIACKVSILAIVWMPFLPLFRADHWAVFKPRAAEIVLCIVLAIAVGFVVGVPGSVRNWSEFMYGVRYLQDHYAGEHPPHSVMGGGWDAPMLLGYLRATVGWPVLLLAAAGGIALARGRRWFLLAIVLGPVLVTIGLFARETVFFERNLSHVIPLLLLASAMGAMALIDLLGHRWSGLRTPAVKIPMAAIALVAMSWVPASVSERVFRCLSLQPAIDAARAERELQLKWPAAEFVTSDVLARGQVDAIVARAKAGRPLLLRLSDYGDRYSSYYTHELETKLAAQHVGEWPTLFPDVPPSTLHTYLSPTWHYWLVTGVE